MEQQQLPVSPGRGPIDPEALGLTEAEAEVRRAAFRSIRRGQPPDASELAEATGLDVEAVREAVGSLVQGGQAVVDAAGRVVGSAGLSLVPARHRLRLGGDEFHTWCAIDAIGIPAALGVDAVARTACPTCGCPIEVEFREGRATGEGEIRAWLPAQDCCTSVIDELCPDMNLFCTEEHLEEWRHRAGDPPGAALTLEKTEDLGREEWGDLV
ncbi:MAG: organomercurial lyase [Actinomycetota bacterium]